MTGMEKENMDMPQKRSEAQPVAWSWVLAISLLTLAIHLLTNALGGYGIFRDEFYYIACSKRLALGYVDQPPLAAHVLALVRWLLGESLFAIRLLPAVLHALTALLFGLMARRLGGGRFAQMLASLAAMALPPFLGWNSIFQLNSLDLFFWTLAAYLLLRIVSGANPRCWLLLGVVVGLGLLNKISMMWFACGVAAALLLTRERKHLRTPWPYLAALVALLIFLPYIIWNIQHHFAHLEFMRNATAGKYAGIRRWDFVSGQILNMNPLALLIWLPGLGYLLLHRQGRMFRVGGIIWVTVFLILLINGHSKAEYLVSAYPPLFAAGACFLEQASRRPRWRWLGKTVAGLLLVSCILLLPLALPVLPVPTYIRYTTALGIRPETWENHRLEQLPQFYADMFGWEELARTVSGVYQSLPDGERAATVVFAQNYGEAGALEYYSRTYPLPAVVCPHNTYWYWGWKYVERGFATVIVIGGSEEDHRRSCEEVQQVAIHRCRYCIPYENNRPIYVCRKFKRPLAEIWNQSRFFI